MDVASESIALSDSQPEIARLRSELEQARVALEDMEQRIAHLTAANTALQGELQREVGCREELERQLQQMRVATLGAATPVTPELVLRQQLSTALEEMHVMAEELSLAQEALRKAATP